jgi:hypothetical protein
MWIWIDLLVTQLLLYISHDIVSSYSELVLFLFAGPYGPHGPRPRSDRCTDGRMDGSEGSDARTDGQITTGFNIDVLGFIDLCDLYGLCVDLYDLY